MLISVLCNHAVKWMCEGISSSVTYTRILGKGLMYWAAVVVLHVPINPLYKKWGGGFSAEYEPHNVPIVHHHHNKAFVYLHRTSLHHRNAAPLCDCWHNQEATRASERRFIPAQVWMTYGICYVADGLVLRGYVAPQRRIVFTDFNIFCCFSFLCVSCSLLLTLLT